MTLHKQSKAVLTATSLSLWFFAGLNILKEAYPGVKAFLNFYPPVGPLLGLFTFSLGFLAAVYLVLSISDRGRGGVGPIRLFMLSVVAFFFLVFPPIFEPIVIWLAGGSH